jgi:hypothetical protein
MAGGASAQTPAPTKQNKYAILVGVTKYPALPERLWLEGPGNDVVLVRTLLVDRFGFSSDNITVLAEATGKDRRPTHANIKAALESLAKKVKANDQVVILLSGHGTQIPDQDPPQNDDPEPDGMDEAFLPADVATWAPGKGVPNAIRDDELRHWLDALVSRDAYVWLIADCCHSGTMLRAEYEQLRKLQLSDLGIPASEVDAADRRAAKVFGRVRGERPIESGLLKQIDKRERLVGVYAARPFEETVELPMPMREHSARVHGLLTYTLCQLLSEAREDRPLTYAELVEKADMRYQVWGRTFPRPLAEGKGRDRTVLGVEAWPSPPFRLTATRDKALAINGGSIHGLTQGTILAVYAVDGARDKPIGHVRLMTVGVLESTAEPCPYGEIKSPARLPDLARCTPVYTDYGDLRVPVAAADRDRTGNTVPEPDLKRLRQRLEQVGKAKGSIVAPVNKPSEARWLLAAGTDGDWICPVHAGVRNSEIEKPWFGPFAANAKPADLAAEFARIAPADNLLRLAGAATMERSGSVSARLDVSVEIVGYKDETDTKGMKVDAGSILNAGQLVAFRVYNRSRTKELYPTILFVDGRYGIQVVYPDEGELPQRLKAGDSFTTELLRLKDVTLGLERIVVIATRKPADLRWLDRPTVREAKLRGAPSDVDSPLGRLFQNALYGEGGTRGLGKADFEEFALAVTQWVTTSACPKK